MAKQYNQLPQVAFSILLALSLKPRHGYEIMKQVEEDSNGKIKLGPGALYYGWALFCIHTPSISAESKWYDDLAWQSH